jgi:malonate transporter and related proteins
MADLLVVVAPVFGLIGIGWLVARLGLLGQRAADGLSEYVFVLAVPALIIRTLTGADLPHVQPWGYWAAYFGGVALTWTLATIIFRRFLGRSANEAAVFGFASSQSNTVLVGVPLILRAYGEEGAVPLFLLLAVHLPIMLTVVTLLIERAMAEAEAEKLIRKLGWTLLTHPILISLFIGVALKVTHLEPAGVPKALLDQLAASASPCALVVMGIALFRHGVTADFGSAALLTGMKLAVHPFLVWVLAFYVFPVPPVWAGVAVLFAALPIGINSFIVAARYKVGEAAASSSIALSTICAVPTVSAWLLILGVS